MQVVGTVPEDRVPFDESLCKPADNQKRGYSLRVKIDNLEDDSVIKSVPGQRDESDPFGGFVTDVMLEPREEYCFATRMTVTSDFPEFSLEHEQLQMISEVELHIHVTVRRGRKCNDSTVQSPCAGGVDSTFTVEDQQEMLEASRIFVLSFPMKDFDHSPLKQLLSVCDDQKRGSLPSAPSLSVIALSINIEDGNGSQVPGSAAPEVRSFPVGVPITCKYSVTCRLAGLSVQAELSSVPFESKESPPKLMYSKSPSLNSAILLSPETAKQGVPLPTHPSQAKSMGWQIRAVVVESSGWVVAGKSEIRVPVPTAHPLDPCEVGHSFLYIIWRYWWSRHCQLCYGNFTLFIHYGIFA